MLVAGSHGIVTSVPRLLQPSPVETFSSPCMADDTLRYASVAFQQLFRLDSVGAGMTVDDLIKRGVSPNCSPRIDCGDVAAFIEQTQIEGDIKPGSAILLPTPLDGRRFRLTETLLQSGWIIISDSEISPLKHS
jgi:hypothetical protein